MSRIFDPQEDLAARRLVSAEGMPISSHEGYSERRAYGAFPAAALNSPMFEGKDLAGLIGAAVITLGPLAAYSFGWGA